VTLYISDVKMLKKKLDELDLVMLDIINNACINIRLFVNMTTMLTE